MCLPFALANCCPARVVAEHVTFLHYYGRGPALELARGFLSALDQLGKEKIKEGMKR